MQMVIITGFFAGETYGLLGPQMAATIIGESTHDKCIVIAVAREDDRVSLKKALSDFFGAHRPVIGFSNLCGREDLFSLAKDIKDEGAITILAGPQADVDFLGEKGWQDHPHRFKGLSENFSFGLHGAAEQAVFLLNRLDGNDWQDTPGLLYRDRHGGLVRNPKNDWNAKNLEKVRWDNIYVMGKKGITPLRIGMGQVLQQIGCPHAARESVVEVDDPVSLRGSRNQKTRLHLKGCSFCDVAADKGFSGKLPWETVLGQIRCLPEGPDGRKIPFELINENPLPGLPDLLRETDRCGIKLSRVHLTMRADGLVLGADHLREALGVAGKLGTYILLSSIGFESFDDTILGNLNKGLKVETNLHAVRLIRQLKGEFPHQMGYANREGAVHGFIHPTPWDTPEVLARTQKTIYLYGLPNDILPPHSTPLIIHHASGLGDWIRAIERREGIRFRRHGSIVCWWEEPDFN